MLIPIPAVISSANQHDNEPQGKPTASSAGNRNEPAGHAPLHTAARYGELEVLKHWMNLLLTDDVSDLTLKLEPGHKLSEALKSVYQQKLSGRHRDFRGNTPLHTACVHGQLAVVKFLTCEIGCDPNDTNSEGLSCLHLAAQHGHLPLVQHLMEEVGSDATLEDEHGRSPSYLAAGGGHLSVLKYMIEERGADTNLELHTSLCL
jgi:ankyrin repeat protein